MNYSLNKNVEAPKSFLIQLKTESPDALKSDIVQAIKYSISLFQGTPSLAGLQSMQTFQVLLEGLKNEELKKECTLSKKVIFKELSKNK
jgi:hypothetical protein